MKHVTDISDRYLIAGETQDIALMFVPSESVYAELHDGFDDVVQKAYRLQVMLVSPTLLMLAIQVIQQIQKDARMREAADQIRDEVGHHDERRRPARATACASCNSTSTSRTRTSARPWSRSKDREARRPHQPGRIRGEEPAERVERDRRARVQASGWRVSEQSGGSNAA